MENKYFDDFFQLLESNTGIAMDGSKAYLFSSRLDPVARLHGFSDFVSDSTFGDPPSGTLALGSLRGDGDQ